MLSVVWPEWREGQQSTMAAFCLSPRFLTGQHVNECLDRTGTGIPGSTKRQSQRALAQMLISPDLQRATGIVFATTLGCVGGVNISNLHLNLNSEERRQDWSESFVVV